MWPAVPTMTGWMALTGATAEGCAAAGSRLGQIQDPLAGSALHDRRAGLEPHLQVRRDARVATEAEAVLDGGERLPVAGGEQPLVGPAQVDRHALEHLVASDRRRGELRLPFGEQLLALGRELVEHLLLLREPRLDRVELAARAFDALEELQPLLLDPAALLLDRLDLEQRRLVLGVVPDGVQPDLQLLELLVGLLDRQLVGALRDLGLLQL